MNNKSDLPISVKQKIGAESGKRVMENLFKHPIKYDYRGLISAECYGGFLKNAKRKFNGKSMKSGISLIGAVIGEIFVRQLGAKWIRWNGQPWIYIDRLHQFSPEMELEKMIDGKNVSITEMYKNPYGDRTSLKRFLVNHDEN